VSGMDRSRPEFPREVTAEHIAADVDHAPVPISGFGDEVSDNCGQCGLATTSDGQRHGFDA
jgi:hypothetical protein